MSDDDITRQLIGPAPQGAAQHPAADTSAPHPDDELTKQLIGPPTGGRNVDAQSSDIPNAPTALFHGIKGSFGDLAQSVQSMTGKPTDQEEPPEAAPYELMDPNHPLESLRTFGSKTAYRIGKGAPTIAAGVAGGLAGSAVEPGVGTVVGGALGAGTMSAAQSIGPEFAAQLKQSPQDPDGAWDRALKNAAISGGATAASWAAFPAFANGVKGLLFQTFGIQPGINVAAQAARNKVEGRDTTEGLGTAYAQGVASTALPVAGKMISKGIKSLGAGTVAPKGSTTPPPGGFQPENITSDVAHDIAEEHYDDIKSSAPPGLTGYGPILSNNKEIAKWRTFVTNSLRNANVGALAGQQKLIYDIVNKLGTNKFGRKTGIIDFGDLMNIRSQLSDELTSTKPSTRFAAGTAMDALDLKMQDPAALVRAGVHPAIAPEIAIKYQQASQWWRLHRTLSAWDEVQDKIDRGEAAGASAEKMQPTEINRILNSKKLQKQYGSKSSPEVLDAMRDGLQGNGWGKLRRLTSSFEPNTPTGVIVDAVTGELFGSPAVAIGAGALAGLVRHMSGAAPRRAFAGADVPGSVRNTIIRRFAPPGALAPEKPAFQRAYEGVYGKQGVPLGQIRPMIPTSDQRDRPPPFAQGGSPDDPQPQPDTTPFTKMAGDVIDVSGPFLNLQERNEERRNMYNSYTSQTTNNPANRAKVLEFPSGKIREPKKKGGRVSRDEIEAAQRRIMNRLH